MKIQKSRSSRQPGKDYSSVCHQQGRMLTDADLTEQALLSRDRLNDALQDVIGSGTPRQGALLQVTEVGDERIPSLHWGRVYVDGVPGRVRADASAPDADQFDYAHQRHYPQAPALPNAAHRLYVDVWERSVIWLEDESLRDPGLHGADTTTRTQTMAQVKWCDSSIDPLCPDVNPPIGDARLRLLLRSLASSADPCDPCADELQLNDPVGNYLFRVEVHDVDYDAGDQPVAVVLKWSSENGAEAYATADVPPDFASNQFVYEFFDEVSEKRLGIHLARDNTNLRIIDGQRPSMVSSFSASSPLAKKFVRRWDGWCRIEKTGADWQLTEGFEGSIDLTSGVGADKPGHVTQGGNTLGIELRVISLNIELGAYPLLAGDYWTVPVRESIHQQGEVLLEDAATAGGVAPEGESHHYLLLVDVAADGTLSLPPASGCDDYNACQPPQFPSLTDLRASDVCFDNDRCEMPEVGTVQDALDHLCQERDLRWHNRHLHGWGIVCGLSLECDPQDPAAVLLRSGYALDCTGNDMVLEDDLSIDIPQRLKEEQIELETLEEDQGVCLYLEFTEDHELDVGIERYQPDKNSWIDRLRDTLLYDFYQDCILDLIKIFTGELQQADVRARCALTRCGQEQIKPVQRRTLTLTNILFQQNPGESSTVLNISRCEHALLEDLYEKLKGHLRSKTFCAHLEELDFPDYPFADAKLCRSTWFTPEPLDHIRLHPGGKLIFGWRRNSARVFVFEQSEKVCLGDLVGYFDVPRLEKGSITDLTIDRDNRMHLTAIVHEQDTLFVRGKLPKITAEDCEIEIDWETSFICGVKIVQLKQSPWSTKQLYAIGLCKGAYLIDPEKLFAEEKIEREPDWAFAASGHMDFDINGTRVIATAAGGKADCAKGEYDRLAIFNARPDTAAGSQSTLILEPVVNDQVARGSDGFVLAQTLEQGNEETSPPSIVRIDELNKNLVLFLVADLNDKKTLCRFDIKGLKKGEGKTQQWQGQLYHPFDAAGHVALKYVRAGKLDGVVATRYAMHDMQYIPGNPRQYEKALLNSIPVQAGPVGIEVHAERKQVQVLNHMGQSITVLSLDLQVYQEQREILRQYRADVIAAFFQLLSGLLQYLKDCFCHHLLIQCPECDEDDKVYLGCLSMRDGKVYNICNFTKRKYVKTFTSFSYWLSLIPIGPLVSWLIERLCCLVLPNYFQQQKPAAFAITPAALGTVKAVMHTDHTNMLQAVSVAGRDVAKKGFNELVRAGYKDRSNYRDLVGVEYHYRPGVIQTARPKIATNEAILEKVGGLESEQGQTEKTVAGMQNEIATLRREKAEVEKRFQVLETDYQDVTVKRLEKVEAEKQQAEQRVAALQQEVAQLKQDKSATEQRFTELEKTVVELDAMRKEVQPVIEGARPITSIEGITPANAKILQRNNITTVKQLAGSDVNRLKEMGIRQNTATSLIEKANARLRVTTPFMDGN